MRPVSTSSKNHIGHFFQCLIYRDSCTIEEAGWSMNYSSNLPPIFTHDMLSYKLLFSKNKFHILVFWLSDLSSFHIYIQSSSFIEDQNSIKMATTIHLS